MATCPKCRKSYAEDVSACPDDGEALLEDEAFANADPDLEAGTKVGEYVIDEKLGEGGFGAVFRATHPLIGKQAAIKVLFRQFSSNPQMVSRFIAEARAVNQIQHRNIIDIFSFGQLEDGRHYYVMELLRGRTLDALLDERGALPLGDALPILKPLARALDAAHAKGIAHRDLKPENIFLASEDDGVVFPKLLDFGIAKLLNTTGLSQHKTRTGAPMGTPYYMSPEQCRGRDVDARTDIYSFGVVAYEMLCGQLPFDGPDFMEILMKQLSEAPIPPSEVNPNLPVEADEPIRWLMEKDAAKRPPDLITAVKQLEELAGKMGLEIAPTGTTGAMMTPRVPRLTPTPAPSTVRVTAASPKASAALESAATLAPENLPTPRADRFKSFVAAESTEYPAQRRRTGLFVGLAAAVVLGGGAAAFVLTRHSAKSTDPQPAQQPVAMVTPDARPTPAILPSPVSSAALAPVSATVTLDLSGVKPDGVEVVLDGKSLGTAPGKFTVPRGAAPQKLELRKASYVTYSNEVALTDNVILGVSLDRKPSTPTPPHSKPTSSKHSKDDVGNFDDP
jgi:serine/threonine-protein kinase